MTIGVLYGREGDRAWCLDGLALETLAGRDGRSLWLGRGGHGTDAHVDGDVLVVSEAHAGGPTASAIAAAYARDGLGCVANLEGSFSFILYDRHKQWLLATSDMTSRLPLAYWFDRDAVVVSSRALRIVAHPRVRRELDEVYLANLFTGLGAAPAGTTPLLDVKRLPAGVAIVSRMDRTELVTVDCLVARSPSPQSKTTCIETLRRELSLAVDRSSREGGASLSLSGGLDSAALASVIAHDPARTAPMRAFSLVAPEQGADEVQAIAELEGAYRRSLTNERIDVSDATALTDLDAFELPDDPTMVPMAYMPARLRLWRAVQRAGLHTVLDGEGGDELFGTLVGARDALGQGEWRAASKYLLSHQARRALFIRSFLLPLAPETMRRGWIERRAQNAESLPTYLTARARAHPAIAQALYEFTEMEIGRNRASVLQQILSNPYAVGARRTHRQVAAEFGVGLSSPFMSRGVVELVLGIPAQWMLTKEYKGFLREASAGRLPERVRTREKDVALPTSLFRRILGSQAVRAMVADGVVHERLDEWIRFERLQAMLDAIANGRDLGGPFLWPQVEGIVSFAYWYRRARREYGIM